MLRVVTAPAQPSVVTLAEAKAQLRLTDTSQDDLVSALAAAATLDAQSFAQRLFITQVVDWPIDCWGGAIPLPVAPVTKAGVISIKYIDWSENEQTLSTNAYVVQTSGPSVRIVPKFGTFWPPAFPNAPEPIVIRFSAGVAIADVPANVKQAVLLTIRHLYSLGSRDPMLTADVVAGVGEKKFAFVPGAATLLTDAARALLIPEIW